jgi:hypothetical protein
LAWFETLWAHGFDPASVPYLLLVKDGSAARFLLPLVENVGLYGLSNFYSSLFEPVGVVDGEIEECLRLCFSHVAADQKRWPFINLQPLAKESAFTRLAAAQLSALGYWTDQYFCFGNWYLPVGDRSYAQFHEQLPAKLRNTIARGRSKLTRAGAWAIRVIPVDEAEIGWGLEAYQAVYQSSWKQPEPFPEFIAALCRMGIHERWLRLGILTLNEKPIAAQLWMVKDDTAYIFKLAYDESFRRFSPGSILTSHMMEQAIDHDHVSVIDYLTGDDAYKQDWMSHRRERVGLIAFNPATTRGLFMGVKHFLGRWAKRLRGGQS